MRRLTYGDVVGVRLGEFIVKRLDILSRLTGRTRSELLREAATLLFARYGLLESENEIEKEMGNQ